MHWVVHRSRSNKEWYFRLVARNGRTVCQSEGYKRKSAALRTCGRINLTFPMRIVE